MDDHESRSDAVTQVTETARAAQDAIRHLSRITVSRPRMTPDQVDLVLAHLAEAVASLQQAIGQLGDILARSGRDRVLVMDDLTPARDPDLAIRTARRHLDTAGDVAADLHAHLHAAHNQTAHIGVADPMSEEATEQPHDLTLLDQRARVSQLPPTMSSSPGPRLGR